MTSFCILEAHKRSRKGNNEQTIRCMVYLPLGVYLKVFWIDVIEKPCSKERVSRQEGRASYGGSGHPSTSHVPLERNRAWAGLATHLSTTVLAVSLGCRKLKLHVMHLT